MNYYGVILYSIVTVLYNILNYIHLCSYYDHLYIYDIWYIIYGVLKQTWKKCCLNHCLGGWLIELIELCASTTTDADRKAEAAEAAEAPVSAASIWLRFHQDHWHTLQISWVFIETARCIVWKRQTPITARIAGQNALLIITYLFLARSQLPPRVSWCEHRSIYLRDALRSRCQYQQPMLLHWPQHPRCLWKQ